MPRKKFIMTKHDIMLGLAGIEAWATVLRLVLAKLDSREAVIVLPKPTPPIYYGDCDPLSIVIKQPKARTRRRRRSAARKTKKAPTRKTRRARARKR